MENTQDNQMADVADMKLLSGKAHEYVVNFRHRFLTYFALPLFLLFIALALVISWAVFVPARSEHAVLLSTSGLKLSPDTEHYLQSKAGKLKSAHINYTGDDGSLIRLNCSIKNSEHLSLVHMPNGLSSGNPINAVLVVFANEDRFLFKLLDELAKNLRIKKLTVSEIE